MMWCRCFLLALLVPAFSKADETGWEHRVARRFSPRLEGIEKELSAIHAELPRLPAVPMVDQGGTGGFASLHPLSKPPEGTEYSVSIRFPATGKVDLITLIPARRYDVEGLEAQFGMPDSFVVELLDGEEHTVAEVADLRDLWSDPVRAGHPFVFFVTPPVVASGLKITARKLRSDGISQTFVHAWSEAFVFEGERNLALNGIVRSSGGTSSPAPWQWNNGFLVDGLTALGLPEIPAGFHPDVGWMAEIPSESAQPVWVELDLGEVREFDSIRLFPSKPPTPDFPRGFGFPRGVTVQVSHQRYDRPDLEPPLRAAARMGNPGQNPVLIPLGSSQGRYVKIDVREFWKAYDNFPAFLALSEVEVLRDEKNLALGSVATSSIEASLPIGSGTEVWNVRSLTDGFGPDGELVSTRAWLTALDHRVGLEMRVHRLQQDQREIVAYWRRIAVTAVAVFALVAAALLIVSPIRYRIRSKRQLAVVRDRIAGDLHDEVGSNLGSIQMLASVAESRVGDSKELKRIQRIAAETVSAVRDIVWLLRPEGDHRIGTVEHLRETASIMLESHDWKFTANEAAWQCELPDDTNRHLFLYFREALHNVIRHAEAKKVEIEVTCEADEFRLSIADDGSGISRERLESPATLSALRKRAETLEAVFSVKSGQGEGTKLSLVIPLVGKGARKSK